MKSFNRSFLLFFLTLSALILSSSFNVWAAGKGYGQSGSGYENPMSNIFIMPGQPLDQNEINAILKMREEEKMARDVYMTLRDRWNLIVFDDIAKSEQNHMDMVKELIKKYGLTDPVTDDSVGSFTQPEFTDLYNQLVSMGMQSVTDALKVGAKIEDLDISDLNNELSLTDNYDVQNVFENLRSGSYNHMQAFVSALEAYGESYTPEYISQDEFETIMNFTKGQGAGYKTPYYTMLPGTMKTYSGAAKSNFTLQPTMYVQAEDQGSTAGMYVLIYWEDQDKWYMMTQPNVLVDWSPGMDVQPFTSMVLNGSEVTFPMFTNPMDLSGLTGVFDVYYGYRSSNGNLIYTFCKVTFE